MKRQRTGIPLTKHRVSCIRPRRVSRSARVAGGNHGPRFSDRNITWSLPRAVAEDVAELEQRQIIRRARVAGLVGKEDAIEEGLIQGAGVLGDFRRSGGW